MTVLVTETKQTPNVKTLQLNQPLTIKGLHFQSTQDTNY